MQIGFHLLEIVELASHDWLNGGNVCEVVGELHSEGDSLLTVLAFDLLSKCGDNCISQSTFFGPVLPWNSTASLWVSRELQCQK